MNNFIDGFPRHISMNFSMNLWKNANQVYIYCGMNPIWSPISITQTRIAIPSCAKRKHHAPTENFWVSNLLHFMQSASSSATDQPTAWVSGVLIKQTSGKASERSTLNSCSDFSLVPATGDGLVARRANVVFGVRKLKKQSRNKMRF